MTYTNLPGRFAWHELLTTDPKAAIDFYTKAVGWKTRQWELDPSYTLWLGERGPVGGVMTLPVEAKNMGAPPHWLSYILAPDVDATAVEAVKLGARTLKPATSLPEVGRFAVLADPQGAVFGLLSPARRMEEDSEDRLGDFTWHELSTSDHVTAFPFYQKLFGWEKTESMEMGPTGIYQMFGAEGKSFGGMYNRPADMLAPPNWVCYAMVRDSRKAAETIKQSGGQICNGPMEVPGGSWIVVALDPQGVAFAVHSMKTAAKTTASPKTQKTTTARRSTSKSKR